MDLGRVARSLCGESLHGQRPEPLPLDQPRSSRRRAIRHNRGQERQPFRPALRDSEVYTAPFRPRRPRLGAEPRRAVRRVKLQLTPVPRVPLRVPPPVPMPERQQPRPAIALQRQLRPKSAITVRAEGHQPISSAVKTQSIRLPSRKRQLDLALAMPLVAVRRACGP